MTKVEKERERRCVREIQIERESEREREGGNVCYRKTNIFRGKSELININKKILGISTFNISHDKKSKFSWFLNIHFTCSFDINVLKVEGQNNNEIKNAFNKIK